MARKSANLRAKESAEESPYSQGVTGAIAASDSVHGTEEAGVSKPKGDKAPTKAQIQKWAKADQEYWGPRNKRMLRHQERFNLVRPKLKDEQEGDLRVYLNDAKVFVEKLAAMIARRTPRIEVPPKGEENAEAAQRIENALRWWTGYLARRWQEGLHNPLPYDQAQSLLLRGWVCERMLLDDEDCCWLNDKVFEPMNIYPRVAGDRISRISHVYSAPVSDLLADFPQAEELLSGKDEDHMVSCIAHYSNREPYWHAVIAEGEWIKKPVKLEYWPWLVAVAKGAFSHHAYPGGQTGDIAEHVGNGFLDVIEDLLDSLQKLLTMLLSTAAKQENPPKVIYTDGMGEVRQLDIERGGQSNLILGDKLEVLELGARPNTVGPIVEILQDRANKVLPAAMFGQGTSLASGFLGALMMGAAEDAVWAFIKALETFSALRYEKMLTIFGQFADKDLEFVSRASEKGENINKGARYWGAQLSPSDVRANGNYVEVIYEDITPQDRVALGNLAIGLVREKLMSLETARGKLLGMDDPELENDRVLAELVNLNPKAVELLTVMKLAQLARKDPLMALLQALMEQKSTAGRPGVGGPGPGGPPGLEGPAQAGLGGVNPQDVPPEMLGQVETVPGDMELLARQMASVGG